MMTPESPASDVDPLLGRIISQRYRVLRKLGEGGMGAVYLTEHILIEKKVALKVLSPELASRKELVARFLQEAKSASRINHENVIDIIDFDQSSDGLAFIAMEFLNGADLGQTVAKDGPMAWPRAQGIALQVCRALRAAHAQGIVHRDMKPENIYLIQREDRADFVKVLDFGIAKVMGVGNAPRLTQTGMIFGTPEYMAPEQADGREPDHRVDIYAMGCVLYHLMTGEAPFKANSFMALLTKHMLEDPVPPSVRRPDLPISPALDALVLKALEKDRDKRWQDMKELMDAIESCDGQQAPRQRGMMTRELGGGIGEVVRRPTVKNPASAYDGDEALLGGARLSLPWAALVVVAALAIGATIWWAFLRPQEPKEPKEPLTRPSSPVMVPQVPAQPVVPPVMAPQVPAQLVVPPVVAPESPPVPAVTSRSHRRTGQSPQRQVAPAQAPIVPVAPATAPVHPQRPDPTPSTPAGLKSFPGQ
jgi:serine/threonine-protein kinase